MREPFKQTSNGKPDYGIAGEIWRRLWKSGHLGLDNLYKILEDQREKISSFTDYALTDYGRTSVWTGPGALPPREYFFTEGEYHKTKGGVVVFEDGSSLLCGPGEEAPYPIPISSAPPSAAAKAAPEPG